MRLLRVYPPAWRARYGEELASLIEELGAGERMSWRMRLDVVRGGLTERVRAVGLAGLPPRERAREGSLLVLYAWMAFVLGGLGVQKASEHWTAVTPPAEQGLPRAAFDVLFVSAGIGAALVLAGLAVALPRLAGLIRAGGWREIRRPIVLAASLSLLAVVITAGLVAWAHSLTPAARNGHDAAYSGLFLAWVTLIAACLFAWAAAAAATARRLALPTRLLRLEAWLGAAVSASMTVITIATVVWWASLARAAATALVPNMIVPVVLMLCATSLGLIGSIRAVNALPKLPA